MMEKIEFKHGLIENELNLNRFNYQDSMFNLISPLSDILGVIQK